MTTFWSFSFVFLFVLIVREGDVEKCWSIGTDKNHYNLLVPITATHLSDIGEPSTWLRKPRLSGNLRLLEGREIIIPKPEVSIRTGEKKGAADWPESLSNTSWTFKVGSWMNLVGCHFPPKEKQGCRKQLSRWLVVSFGRGRLGPRFIVLLCITGVCCDLSSWEGCGTQPWQQTALVQKFLIQTVFGSCA